MNAMMKTLMTLTACTAAAVVSYNAQAAYTPIYLDPPGVVNNNQTEAQDVFDALSPYYPALTLADIGTLLYKTNEGGVEEGDAGLFEPTYASPPTSVTLDYTGGSPSPLLTYIVVKAGNQFTVWDASAWDGSDDIFLQNTQIVNTRGAARDISHVSVFGTTGPDPIPTPDAGATLTLLGLGLLGLGMLSRRAPKA